MRDKGQNMIELAQEHMVKTQHPQRTWYYQLGQQRSFDLGQKIIVMLPTSDIKLLAK